MTASATKENVTAIAKFQMVDLLCFRQLQTEWSSIENVQFRRWSLEGGKEYRNCESIAIAVLFRYGVTEVLTDTPFSQFLCSTRVRYNYPAHSQRDG